MLVVGLALAHCRYDGQAYRDMFKWAQEEPLNRDGRVTSAYATELRPMLTRSRL